jgi:uncharacterized protein involved in response to NO
MGRSLYILAAALTVFAMISFGVSYTGVAQSPGDASLWRTMGLVFLVIALVVALGGVLTALFEQAERRAEDERAQRRSRRR